MAGARCAPTFSPRMRGEKVNQRQRAAMSRAEVLQEIRRMRFEALLEGHEQGELNQIEAAAMLGFSERTFRRWRDRLGTRGQKG